MTTEEILQKTVAPENIKNAVREFNWRAAIQNIAEKHHLHIDDTETFQQITVKIALGLIASQNFKAVLERKLLISGHEAENLVQEANTEILKKIQKNAFTKTKEKSSIKTEKKSFVHNDKYHEPIELSDLGGVMQHRTPYTHHEGEKLPEDHLSKKLYQNPFKAQNTTNDFSPSEKEQLIEDGNFLKHIKNSSDIKGN